MHCIHCGHELDDDSCFCQACGMELDGKSQTQKPEAKVPEHEPQTEGALIGQAPEAAKPVRDNSNLWIYGAVAGAVVILAGAYFLTFGRSVWDKSDIRTETTAVSTEAGSTYEATEQSEFWSEDEAETTREADQSAQESLMNMDDPEFMMFPYSAEEDLSKEDMETLTDGWKASIARNEIYARHGFVFKKNASVRDYFEAKSWYSPDPSFTGSDSELNSFERENIHRITALEKARGWN